MQAAGGGRGGGEALREPWPYLQAGVRALPAYWPPKLFSLLGEWLVTKDRSREITARWETGGGRSSPTPDPPSCRLEPILGEAPLALPCLVKQQGYWSILLGMVWDVLLPQVGRAVLTQDRLEPWVSGDISEV